MSKKRKSKSTVLNWNSEGLVKTIEFKTAQLEPDNDQGQSQTVSTIFLSDGIEVELKPLPAAATASPEIVAQMNKLGWYKKTAT